MRVDSMMHRWSRSRWLFMADIGLWGWVGGGLVSLVLITSVSAYTSYGHNAVGLNTHIPSPETLEFVRALGVQWIRVDNNWFQHGHPCSDAIEFLPALDTAVNAAIQNGLYVYMTLSYTAACGSTGGNDDRDFNDVPVAHWYANFVRQAVRHYRALGVRHFGMWNEPNGSGFFEGTADQYVDHVLLPGFPAVAAGCNDLGVNDCLVLGPELAHVGDYHPFLERVIYRMQMASLIFDIFTHHIYQEVATPPYERDSFVNALDDQRFSFTRPSFIDVLNQMGWAPDRIPVRQVWITETGYRAQPPTDEGEMRRQADRYLEILNVQAARPWYTNTIFYEIVDPNTEADGYGIMRYHPDGTYFLKEAYLDLQDRLATDPRFFPGGPGGYQPTETPVCTKLGQNGFFSSLPDADEFKFHGTAGELVSVRLDRDPRGPNEGKHATLILEGHGLFFVSRGPLMNDITVTLPNTGGYKVIVAEQADFEEGSRFRGDYCVTLESSDAAFATFERN
jgi:hypothetical protein